MIEKISKKTTAPKPVSNASKTSVAEPASMVSSDYTVTITLKENKVVVAPPELNVKPGDWVTFDNQATDCVLIIICTMEKENPHGSRRRGVPFTNGGHLPNPRQPLKVKSVNVETMCTYSAFLIDGDGVLHDSDPSIIIRPLRLR